MPESLYQRYRSIADAKPDAPAMTFLHSQSGAVTYTYADLFGRAEEIGALIAARQPGRAAPLGLLLQRQESQVLHYLGALYANTVPALLTPPNRKLNREYYQETMDAVLRRCAFGAVITDIAGICLRTEAYSAFTLEDLPDQASRVSAPCDSGLPPIDASFLQFSSGTTGMKRGVMVSDEAVSAQLDTYAGVLGLTEDDCILSWLPLYHDMGFIACLNMALACGVHSVMIDPIDWVTKPALYLRAVATYRATLSWHPNFAYAFMAQRVRDADLEGVDLSTLRGLINCSEPVTYEAQQAFMSRYAHYGLSQDVYKGCYAMAETTFALTHGTVGDAGYVDADGPTDGTRSPSPAGYVSVGQTLPGVELRIVDPHTLEPLGDRRVGEIWVRSPFNFSGYFNDAEATAAALVDGWYRTGDLGYRAGSSFYVAGRLKDVLIVGGVNVFPQDIEDVVSGIDGVHPGRVSAFSVFDPKVQTERIIILAEADVDDENTRRITQEIRQQVLAAFQVANFEVTLVSPGWLVKSSSGKMARSGNRHKWLIQVSGKSRAPDQTPSGGAIMGVTEAAPPRMARMASQRLPEQ